MIQSFLLHVGCGYVSFGTFNELQWVWNCVKINIRFFNYSNYSNYYYDYYEYLFWKLLVDIVSVYSEVVVQKKIDIVSCQ